MREDRTREVRRPCAGCRRLIGWQVGHCWDCREGVFQNLRRVLAEDPELAILAIWLTLAGEENAAHRTVAMAAAA